MVSVGAEHRLRNVERKHWHQLLPGRGHSYIGGDTGGSSLAIWGDQIRKHSPLKLCHLKSSQC